MSHFHNQSFFSWWAYYRGCYVCFCLYLGWLYIFWYGSALTITTPTKTIHNKIKYMKETSTGKDRSSWAHTFFFCLIWLKYENNFISFNKQQKNSCIHDDMRVARKQCFLCNFTFFFITVLYCYFELTLKRIKKTTNHRHDAWMNCLSFEKKMYNLRPYA